MGSKGTFRRVHDEMEDNQPGTPSEKHYSGSSLIRNIPILGSYSGTI